MMNDFFLPVRHLTRKTKIKTHLGKFLICQSTLLHLVLSSPQQMISQVIPTLSSSVSSSQIFAFGDHPLLVHQIQLAPPKSIDFRREMDRRSFNLLANSPLSSAVRSLPITNPPLPILTIFSFFIFCSLAGQGV